jgi:hypothetical protein
MRITSTRLPWNESLRFTRAIRWPIHASSSSPNSSHSVSRFTMFRTSGLVSHSSIIGFSFLSSPWPSSSSRHPTIVTMVRGFTKSAALRNLEVLYLLRSIAILTPVYSVVYLRFSRVLILIALTGSDRSAVHGFAAAPAPGWTATRRRLPMWPVPAGERGRPCYGSAISSGSRTRRALSLVEGCRMGLVRMRVSSARSRAR